MKSLSLLALVALPLTNAHYIFDILYVNGKAITGRDYDYVRKNTNSYMPSFTDEVVNSNDARCNKGAKAGSTQTYSVNAGDKIALKLFNKEFIEHPGREYLNLS